MYDEADQVRAVYDDTGALVASYVVGRGFGEVLAEVVPGLSGDPADEEARYALRDKLGTPVAWLDETGATYAEVHRDAFGVRAQSPSVPVPYGYTGHAEDPTGLVWGRARYLEPVHGVWLSEDPVWTEGRYGYVSNAPLEFVDPSGRALIDTAGTIVQAACTTMGVGTFFGGWGGATYGALSALAGIDSGSAELFEIAVFWSVTNPAIDAIAAWEVTNLCAARGFAGPVSAGAIIGYIGIRHDFAKWSIETLIEG